MNTLYTIGSKLLRRQENRTQKNRVKIYTSEKCANLQYNDTGIKISAALVVMIEVFRIVNFLYEILIYLRLCVYIPSEK